MFIERLRAVMPRLVGAMVRSESLVLLAVVSYIFLAPNVDFAPSLTWHDGQRIAQLVLISVVLAFTFAVPGAGNAVATIWVSLPRWSRVALFTAFALGIVSAMKAPLWRWALLEWAMLLLLLVVVLGVAVGRRSGGDSLDRLLVVVIYATATAYVAKVVVVYLAMLTVGPSYGQVFNVRELFTGFSNIRFFGHLQTMLLPFLLLPAMLWTKTLNRRLLLIVVPALWWMLAAASGTRGTWVALTVGVLAVLLFGGQTGQRWIKWQLSGLVCGLLCYAAFVLLVPQLINQPAFFLHRAEDIVSLSGREVIWTAAIGFFWENLLFGIGPMHFAYYANAIAAHPHNAVLQFMAEWGIPAALLFTVVFAAGGLAFARWVRRATAGSDAQAGLAAVALLAALAGAAAQAMVDGIMVMPVSQTLLALLCGWAMGSYFTVRSRMERCAALEKRLGAAIIALAAGSIAYGVLPDVGHIEQREDAYLATRLPGALLSPRFWAQGWINP